MKSPRHPLLLAAILALLASGCALDQRVAAVQDTLRFRYDLWGMKKEVKQAELERERRELERLRRAELNEVKSNTAEMVPELKTALETRLNQKITDLRIVPDYAAMASAASTLAEMEEKNERIYQEELALWLKDECEAQRLEAQFASWPGFCPIHGPGRKCDCKQKGKGDEPDCANLPKPRAPVREMPRKPVLPNVPVKYKMEFALEQDVDSSAFTEAQPGRAPVKELCLPDKDGKEPTQNAPAHHDLLHSRTAELPDDLPPIPQVSDDPDSADPTVRSAAFDAAQCISDEE